MIEYEKKIIVVELDGNWVLKHRDDDKLPIDVIKGELSTNKALTLKDSTLTSVAIIYTEELSNYSGVASAVKRILAKHYPDEQIKKIVQFHSEIYVDEEMVKGTSQTVEERRKQLEQQRQEFFEHMRQEFGDNEGDDEDEEDDEDIDFGTSPKKDESAIGKINSLVGATEFKALANEIVGIADEIARTNTYDVFTNKCYLFAIGDGCGLTTYLNYFAWLISENKLCKMSSANVIEEKLGEYSEGEAPFKDAETTLRCGNIKNVKVFCVDISEWMDKTDTKYFKQFLRTVEKHAEEFIVVFRVPFVDKDVLARIKYSLSDLLSVKVVSFPPFNYDEIKVCAEEQLKGYNFSITKSAWKYFFERISEEKSDGKFYGINTVKKVVRELVYQKVLANSKQQEKSMQITVNDTKAICAEVNDSNLSGIEQLNKLVGIDSIKKRVEEIIAQIELSLKDPSIERPCIHMRFVGNPGTGKTTVARLIGKILKEKGVLRIGAFFEYSGRDFCGRYVGETAPKTTSICRDAYGSVLFIDEAYSLYRGNGDTKDFGREAIDTLIAEMENHRNDFMVIMAGYTSDMDNLMSGNLGLASRMPYTIEFPNFTREQLYDIFVSMVKSKFKYDESLFDAAHDFFINLPDELISSKEFSNARYVRNLFERTWAKAAMRCQLNSKTDIVLIKDDFEHASADKEFATNIPKKTRMGFNN